LTADATDIGSALDSYDQARRPRSQNLARASARVARLAKAHNAVIAGVHDLAAWLLPNAAFLRTADDRSSWRTPPNAEHG
jgi:2-polyprenyl-6-methoxyphenol hydroxylase-like FAD-dependent oxidoreductase